MHPIDVYVKYCQDSLLKYFFFASSLVFLTKFICDLGNVIGIVLLCLFN